MNDLINNQKTISRSDWSAVLDFLTGLAFSPGIKADVTITPCQEKEWCIKIDTLHSSDQVKTTKSQFRNRGAALYDLYW